MAIQDYYKDLTLTMVEITENSFGGEETTEVDTTIKGVINQAGAAELEYANARNIEVDYNCYVEVSETTEGITLNDKINGKRVTMPPKNTMDRNHHLKILLAEV